MRFIKKERFTYTLYKLTLLFYLFSILVKNMRCYARRCANPKSWFQKKGTYFITSHYRKICPLCEAQNEKMYFEIMPAANKNTVKTTLYY